MAKSRLLMVAENAGGSPPLCERRVIRDSIAEQLSGEGVTISAIGDYIIRIKPCFKSFKNLSQQELTNSPVFSIDCEDSCVVVRTIRATSVRTIATVEYADPFLLEKLADALSAIGLCLLV